MDLRWYGAINPLLDVKNAGNSPFSPKEPTKTPSVSYLSCQILLLTFLVSAIRLLI